VEEWPLASPFDPPSSVLELPRVTLCCVDCVNHDLALTALQQCVESCTFGRALFVTDRHYDLDGLDCLRIAPLRSREDYSRFVIKELAAHVATDYVLLVQWDGFVVNPAAWREEFLDYDYIGARWPSRDDGFTVGNGGFSLRSRRLLHALQDPHVLPEPLEDVAICRTFRPRLEHVHGIRFAPEDVADRFSFEAHYFDALPFGFHGLFNFWMFLDARGLAHLLAHVSPAILASEQCRQLARNYLELGRRDEARLLLDHMLAAHPHGGEMAVLRASLDPSAPAAGGTTPVGRNDPCPCGSGKRYKACHGAV